MIDKCFRCNGEGLILIANVGAGVGCLTRYEHAQCSKCQGSGVLEYRIVETSPPQKEVTSPPLGVDKLKDYEHALKQLREDNGAMCEGYGCQDIAAAVLEKWKDR